MAHRRSVRRPLPRPIRVRPRHWQIILARQQRFSRDCEGIDALGIPLIRVGCVSVIRHDEIAGEEAVRREEVGFGWQLPGCVSGMFDADRTR